MLADLKNCHNTEEFIKYNNKIGFSSINADSEILNKYLSFIKDLQKEKDYFTANLICRSIPELGERNHDKSEISSLFFKHDTEFSYLFDFEENKLIHNIKLPLIKEILFDYYPFYIPALIRYLEFTVKKENLFDTFANSYNGLIFSFNYEDYNHFEKIYIFSRKKLNLENKKLPSFKCNYYLSAEQIKTFYKFAIGEEIKNENLVRIINNSESNIENTFLDIIKNDKFTKNNKKIIEIISSKNL